MASGEWLVASNKYYCGTLHRAFIFYLHSPPTASHLRQKTTHLLLTIVFMVSFACLNILNAQVTKNPLDSVPDEQRGLVLSVVENADFMFETATDPIPVSVSLMEQLFDRPRLAAAMWRHCQFEPPLFAFEHGGGGLTVDDSKGLYGTMTLVDKSPGQRIYYIEGRIERWRMGNPMAVSAHMIVVYSYRDTPKGFVSYLKTWTKLDSALAAAISRPFRGYVRRRQQEFIVYINNNIAKGGYFAQINPQEFKQPIATEGDTIAMRQFEEVFESRR